MKNRRTLFYLFVLLFLTFTSFGQKKETKKIVIVSTADEFINAIESNRIIKLSSGIFYLRDVEKLKSIPLGKSGKIRLTKNVIYIAGNGITIIGVSNLDIIGVKNKKTPSVLSTRDKGDIVLTFRNCKDITLKYFEANHLPKTDGSCQGGVLFFDESENIEIYDCTLLGSGTFGIQCNDVTNLRCKKTIIKECSSYLFEFKRSSSFKFINCQFSQIKCTGMFTEITDCQSFEFHKCHFDKNYSDTTGSYYKPDRDFLFYFYRDKNSKDFLFSNCMFTDNKIKWFTNKSEIFTRKQCRYKNNDSLR